MLIKLIKKNKYIIAILIIALVMRVVVLNQSLWMDEAIGALVVRDLSFKKIFTNFLVIDNHPPLYYLLLKLWSGIFGYSEAALRFPSILFSLGSIVFTYEIAKQLSNGKNKYFSLFSALLIATSQFAIYYSQEARMYSMAMFFATISVFSFLKTQERKKQNLYWIIFSFSLAGLIFTDYVPVFLLPVFWIYGWISKFKKDWWIKFILSHLPLLAFSIIWLPYLAKQILGGARFLSTLPAWKAVAGGATIKQAVLVWNKFAIGRISFTNKVFYYLLIIVFSPPFFIALLKAWRARSKTKMLWLWFVFPLIFGFVVSFLFPAFIYFRFLFVVPAFYLLVGWGISNLKSKLFRRGILLSLVTINLFVWFVYIIDPSQQRENWRDAVRFIDTTIKANEVVVFEYPEPFAPYRWYSKDLSYCYGVTNSISADPQKTSEITAAAIKGRSAVYYFEYLRDLSDPQRVVENEIKSQGFSIKEVFNYIGVGQLYYWTR